MAVLSLFGSIFFFVCGGTLESLECLVGILD